MVGMAWWWQWLCPQHLEHEVEAHSSQAGRKQEDTGHNQDQFTLQRPTPMGYHLQPGITPKRFHGIQSSSTSVGISSKHKSVGDISDSIRKIHFQRNWANKLAETVLWHTLVFDGQKTIIEMRAKVEREFSSKQSYFVLYHRIKLGGAGWRVGGDVSSTKK